MPADQSLIVGQKEYDNDLWGKVYQEYILQFICNV